MSRVILLWLLTRRRNVEVLLFSIASMKSRASRLPDCSKTAVGMCLTSVLMASAEDEQHRHRHRQRSTERRAMSLVEVD